MESDMTGSAVVDRPIDTVFAFLADGTNDLRFSPRVKEIRKATDGPTAVGTVYESTVKDGGMTTRRTFEITEFEAPTRIRWSERSKNIITVPEGGYDLERVDDARTKVTIHNCFAGHGFGKVIRGFVARQGQKDAPVLAERIKQAIEAD
jgi:carbon monoxide dehydrogenase subunit G